MSNSRIGFRLAMMDFVHRVRRDFVFGRNIRDRLRPILSIWDKIFAISCVFSVAFDPLFFYVVITNVDMKCLRLDRNLRTTALVLRSFTDVFYMVELIRNLKGVMIQYREDIRNNNLREIISLTFRNRMPRILISFFAVVPVPQLIIILHFTRGRGSISTFGNFIILLQYAVRIFCIYQARMVFRSMVSSVWLNGLLKFIMFMIASHVIGSLCYFFSFQRELRCWEDKCPSGNRCTFGCDDDPTVRNITVLNKLCPINPPNATLFDFGIFLDSLQSGMLESTDLLQKISYYFWWGLRQLSSFGSNLQTSTYAWENLFAAFVSITGMLLFLIYLNELIQRYMQISASKLEEDERLTDMRRRREPQIVCWLYENGLPMNWKEDIMKNAEFKLGPHEEVNLENVSEVLPYEWRSSMVLDLCLPMIIKVPGVGPNLEKEKMEALCLYLKPVIYKENSYIFKENETVDKIVFITQGTVYTTSNFSSNTCLKRGDFCGDELIDWAKSHPRDPVSKNEKSHSTKMDGSEDIGASKNFGPSTSTQSVNLKDKKMKAHEESHSTEMERLDSDLEEGVAHGRQPYNTWGWLPLPISPRTLKCSTNVEAFILRPSGCLEWAQTL